MRIGRYPQASDKELVVYATLGRLEAFDELVRRYRVAVALVAGQVLSSRAAAEDVAQETFLLAFKALPQLREPEKFAGWVCAIARHRARRVAAREERNLPTEPSKMDRLLLAHSQELSVSPEARCAQSEQDDCISKAFARLSFDLGLPLRLYYFEQWPVARIAAFLSLPVTTIKWRLHRGRTLLRQALTTREEKENE